MKLAYAVVYERTPNNYSAYAPDVPGCISTGDTWEEIQNNMREAITYHLEMLRDYGDPIPEPQLSAEEGHDVQRRISRRRRRTCSPSGDGWSGRSR